MKPNVKKQMLRQRRKLRIRKKVRGTPARPRLTVYRSLKHIYAQVIDDTTGRTLVATSTLDPALRDALGEGNKKDAARKVGQRMAALCKAKDITRVVFDRNGFDYHGRVSSLADGAREGGLQF